MQEISFLLQSSPTFLISLIFVIGLMVGSFLNVVIFRLPVMMQRGWKQECIDFLELEPENTDEETLNLTFPLSRCPVCKTSIKPYQNIPVVSYLLLGGKCASCKSKISIRYPLIELFTGLMSALVAWHFGYGMALFGALVFTWCLIALSFIDIDHQLLPDSINYPLLWLGLFFSLFTVFTDSHSSIIGAIAGYLSLWSVYHVFKWVTGKEGMGFGDFKLLAVLGAWLGWHYLPLIILLSSLVGTVIGITMIILTHKDHRIPIPFGPYLASAGWLALIYGEKINTLYLNYIGL